MIDTSGGKISKAFHILFSYGPDSVGVLTMEDGVEVNPTKLWTNRPMTDEEIGRTVRKAFLVVEEELVDRQDDLLRKRLKELGEPLRPKEGFDE